MALQPLDQEQILPVAQTLLAFLDRDDVTIPGNLLEAIVSGKSLLRGLLQGGLVVCQVTQDAPVVKPEPEPEEKAA